MNEENKSAAPDYARVLLNILIPAGGTLLVCMFLPKALRFFMPFVVGWIIAMIANPVVRFLESRLKSGAQTWIGTGGNRSAGSDYWGNISAAKQTVFRSIWTFSRPAAALGSISGRGERDWQPTGQVCLHFCRISLV